MLILINKYQISKAGRWDTSVVTNVYLSHLPRQFMLTLAGFPPEQSGTYFLTRGGERPPEQLMRKVFPWIEEWEERFRERTKLKTYLQGGLDEDDIAGKNFIILCKQLREVFLQDAAVLQKEYSDHPIYQDKLFEHAL